MHDFAKSGPFTEADLHKVRERLAKMSPNELRKFYISAWHVSRLDDQGRPPQAAFIQQLVQAWKEMRRRRSKAV
jgi:hypothetical protein